MCRHLKKLLKLTKLIRIHTQILILTTAFLNICPTTFAGLAIDTYLQKHTEQAQVGDPCDYYAFLAFRLPILEIIVRTHGRLKEQNLEIARYESFVYKNASNVTTHYNYVPAEFQDLICRSRRIPLMCVLKNPSNGMGVCVCLEVNITDKEGDMGAVLVVRTSLAKSINGTNWNDSSVARSMDANQTRAYLRFHRKPLCVDSELDCNYTQCYADFGTFCGTPYINCRPYLDPTGALTTACVLGVCGTSRIFPAAIHLMFIVFSALQV